jgi:hypothetical protein
VKNERPHPEVGPSAAGHVELDLLVLGERLEAGAGDAGVVHEHVAVTAVLRDEAEALGLVEPLDGSGCHSFLLEITAVETRRRWCLPRG